MLTRRSTATRRTTRRSNQYEWEAPKHERTPAAEAAIRRAHTRLYELADDPTACMETFAPLFLALASRRPAAGLVHHSDRGSQYTSHEYRGLLECHGIVIRMSGKGEPYDNALLESFFGTLKAECVERHDFQTPTQARACIFEYLEVFYNRQRLHSALGYYSPLAFAQMPVVT